DLLVRNLPQYEASLGHTQIGSLSLQLVKRWARTTNYHATQVRKPLPEQSNAIDPLDGAALPPHAACVSDDMTETLDAKRHACIPGGLWLEAVDVGGVIHMEELRRVHGRMMGNVPPH